MSRGLLGTRATLVADINLILQIVILIVLVLGTFRARRRGVRAGRTWLSIAVVCNAVLIIAVMNPSFFRILPFALDYPLAPVPKLLWPHVLMGSVAGLIGVSLAVSTNLDWGRSWQVGRLKWTTRSAWYIMLLLWSLALVIGLVVYFRLYT
jgi:hypothetical protein